MDQDDESNLDSFKEKDFEEFYNFYKSSPYERLLLHETLFGKKAKSDFSPLEKNDRDVHVTHFSDQQNFEKNVHQIPKTRENISRLWGSEKDLDTIQDSTDESLERIPHEMKERHLSDETQTSSTNNGKENEFKNMIFETNYQTDIPSSDSSICNHLSKSTNHSDNGTCETASSKSPRNKSSVNADFDTSSLERACSFQRENSSDVQQNQTDVKEWNFQEVMDEFERRYNYENNAGGNLSSNYRSEPSNVRMYEVLEDFATANEFEIEDSAPNGNCMFQAVRDQLAMKGDFRFTALCLRQKAVDYLRENPINRDGTRLSMFLPKDESWYSYLSKMSMTSHWGDNLTLMALSKSLGRHIVVFSVSSDGDISQHEFRPVSKDPESYDHTLYLGHLRECHYVSLRHASWRKTWSENAKICRQTEILEFNVENPGKNNKTISEVQESLRLMPDVIDPITGIPMPHFSFVLKNLIEEYHIHPLIRPFPLTIREDYQDYFNIITIGGKSDGTDVILEPNRNDSITANVFDMEERCSTELMVCKKYQVCEGNLKSELSEVIRAETDYTHPGYCRLRRGHVHETIGCWHCSCNQCKVYLKGWKPMDCDPDDPVSVRTAEKIFPAYECPKWPTSANEWLSRKSNTGWPSNYLKKKVEGIGCHIMKRAHFLSAQPEIEWQFVFSEAEKLLFSTGLSAAQKYVYKIFRVLVDFHSQHLKVRLHTVHIKTVFFFACEEIVEVMFDAFPGSCLLFVLGNLLKRLQNHDLPNYFIRSNNMIDHFSNEDVEKLISAVETIRLFPLQSVMLMMSSKGHHRSWVIDIISQDFQQYAKDKDLNRVRSKLFFPTSMLLARKLATEKEFHQAYAKIREAELELIMSPLENHNGNVKVPDIKLLFQEAVQLCDEETRLAFTVIIEEKINCPLFDDCDRLKRVRDIMDGHDADEYADKAIPRDCVGNTHAEAKFLFTIGCELQNEKRKPRAAMKFLEAAIDLLESEVDQTVNFAVVNDEVIRRQISPQKHHSLGIIYHSLHVYYRNLYNGYTFLWETDKMRERMPRLERVCRHLALQEFTDYVAFIWSLLGEPEKASALCIYK